MDDLIDYMMLTFAILFVLFMVVLIVAATVMGVYEPILALAFWLLLVAVCGAVAAVIQWLVEK